MTTDLPDTAVEGSLASPPRRPVSGGVRFRFAKRLAGGGDELSAILSLVNSSDLITFSGGFPAPETFPAEFVRALTAQASAADTATAFQYTPSEGLASLRDTLGQWIGSGQGLRPAEDELMITSGGIEALSLLSKALLDPGDRVLVEAPTYLGAITAFTGFEAQVDAVPMDGDGVLVEAFEAALRHGPTPKMFYVIPDFQNPTGLWLSTERRHALVEIARRAGVLIVEDVAYRELAFAPEPRPSLWSLAPDVVVQVGTFSKIFSPGVRLGWAAGPAPLVNALVRAKQNSDQCAGGLGQWLVEAYLRNGALEPQLVRSRALYEQRCTAMLEGLAEHLPEGASWTHPLGGFFTWVTVPDGVDTAALVPRAAELGVAYVPGSPFYPDRGRRDQLRLAFSRADQHEIAEGTSRLGQLLKEAVG